MGTFSLTDFIRETKGEVADFRPMPQYFPDGDHLSVFFSEEMCVAERVDDLVTVYLSESERELIGCKIKGVSRLLENTSRVFDISHEDVTIQMLLASALSDANVKEHVYKIVPRLKDIKLAGVSREVEEFIRNRESNHAQMSV